ncbi:MAG: DUF488 domain-containing protein [Acidimicrobiales bacterium]
MTKDVHEVDIVRVYDDPGRDRGGLRVLVDRLWPRGLSKESVDFDEWAKDAAPSTELRRWYGHDPSRFAEFRKRYREELAEPAAAEAVARLGAAARSDHLVLLTATRDVEHSGATVLREVVEATVSGGRRKQ